MRAHRWTGPELTETGRETFLVTVEWEDDWPIFNGGKNITFETEGRASLTPSQATGLQKQWAADFSKEELELGWYQKSKHPILSPGPKEHQLTREKTLLSSSATACPSGLAS